MTETRKREEVHIEEHAFDIRITMTERTSMQKMKRRKEQRGKMKEKIVDRDPYCPTEKDLAKNIVRVQRHSVPSLNHLNIFR